MKLKDVIKELELLAPASLQEAYDNSGLILGDLESETDSALICLDSTEAVVDEAIQKKCQLIIAHHPIVFSGLKSITGKNYIERVILKAIKNNIAIYAIHTNLDNVFQGVNKKIAEKLGLQNLRILKTKTNLLKKLVVFCPTDSSEKVSKAVFDAGAGKIGNYDHCSFSLLGEGSFRGNEASDPTIGNRGEITRLEEKRLEFLLPKYSESSVVKALLETHPYEEVAYDLYSLSNHWQGVGSGMLGELPIEVPSTDFLRNLKKVFTAEGIRYTNIHKKNIQKVAVCGGSGSFLLEDAIAAGADIFVTADFKYHQFFDADNKIIIADIGHFESEQYTSDLIAEYLSEKLSNFATYLSQVKTNPINYI